MKSMNKYVHGRMLRDPQLCVYPFAFEANVFVFLWQISQECWFCHLMPLVGCCHLLSIQKWKWNERINYLLCIQTHGQLFWHSSISRSVNLFCCAYTFPSFTELSEWNRAHEFRSCNTIRVGEQRTRMYYLYVQINKFEWNADICAARYTFCNVISLLIFLPSVKFRGSNFKPRERKNGNRLKLLRFTAVNFLSLSRSRAHSLLI